MNAPPIQQNVSRETFAGISELFDRYATPLNEYVTQLRWWNQRLNLISKKLDNKLLYKHLLHSLTPLILDFWGDTKLIIDAGTGGGLPGIPLAITTPEKPFILNDINQRKTFALKQIIRSLKIDNVKAEQGDIGKSSLPDDTVVISKHAFKVNELCQKLQRKSWRTLVFLKGDDFVNELTGIPDDLTLQYFKLETGTEDPFFKSKVLVTLKKIEQSDSL